MSKITVITDAAGEIIVIGHGHLSEQTARNTRSYGLQAGLRAGPGQQIHELDVPENLGYIMTWSELHAKVQPHLKRP